MSNPKADIIARLQREVLSMQGLKTTAKSAATDKLIGTMKNAFPNNSFPLGVMHEFISRSKEDEAAGTGFITAIVSSLMRSSGVAVWISSSRTVFPPALKSYGIEPDKIIFIDLKKEKEILWTMEEALKCRGLAAVIGELQELDFTASRRLQLAVEQSRVTGFVLRCNPRNINTTACLTRWQVKPALSELPNEMPGVGFPRWNVELLKVRNGNPGKWQVEFAGGRFKQVSTIAALPLIQKVKTG